MGILLEPPIDQRLDSRESELIARLSEGLPEIFWERWYALREKAEKHSLTAQEQTERESMIPTLERWHLTCMECVLKIAEIRGESPHSIAKSLGLGFSLT